MAVPAPTATHSHPIEPSKQNHVIQALLQTQQASPLLTDAQSKGALKIVGGIYRLASSKVELIV